MHYIGVVVYYKIVYIGLNKTFEPDWKRCKLNILVRVVRNQFTTLVKGLHTLERPETRRKRSNVVQTPAA